MELKTELKVEQLELHVKYLKELNSIYEERILRNGNDSGDAEKLNNLLIKYDDAIRISLKLGNENATLKLELKEFQNLYSNEIENRECLCEKINNLIKENDAHKTEIKSLQIKNSEVLNLKRANLDLENDNKHLIAIRDEQTRVNVILKNENESLRSQELRIDTINFLKRITLLNETDKNNLLKRLKS